MESEPTHYCPGDLDIVRLSAVQCVATRPEMFTPTGSTGEIFSFFRDYDPSQDAGAILDVAGFQAAVAWLGNECGFEPFSSNLDEVVNKIETRFGSREEFLEALVAAFPTE